MIKIKEGQRWRFESANFSYICKVCAQPNNNYCMEVIKVITDLDKVRPIGFRTASAKPEIWESSLNVNVNNSCWFYIDDGVGEISNPTIQYGATCQKCKEYNQYVETSPHFTCYGCRN